MEMDGAVLFFALVFALAFGAWTRSIAVKKGYSGGFFWLGFFFPLIGVIIAACLTDQSEQPDYPPAFNPYSNESPSQGAYQYGNNTTAAQALSKDNAATNPPAKVETAEGKEWVVCSKCGTRSTVYFAKIRKQCPSCGTPFNLEADLVKASGDGRRAEPDQEKPVGLEMTARDWPCGACGGHNPPQAAFCMHCGLRKPNEWACGDCGGANPPAAKFCMQCGKKFMM